MALVADCITYLKNVLDSTVSGEYVTSVGSPAAQGDLPTAYAAMAYGGDDRPGVIGARDDRLAYGNETIGDRFLIWVTISKASGDVDPHGLLSDVEDQMDAFTGALDEDKTMGGILLADGRAVFGSHEWLVEDAGNIATVFFQVDITRRW